MIIARLTTENNTLYRGILKTLTINTEIEAQKITSENPKAPLYRLIAGEVEIGAIFKARGPERPMEVKIDSPELPAPIWAAAWLNDDGGVVITWDRPKPRPRTED